ncbi:SH3 domain-containing protein [Streptomyces sp. NPDC002138]|uniref:SH3 domain-containing protein n=1 Tax=Streptomyces sp. NPDC002138 TaxID=3154410 RepID=UPI0033208C05
MPFISITSKPTRTVLALAAGSLLLGLSGAGAAVADDGPATQIMSNEQMAARHPGAAPRPDDDDREREYALGKVVSKGPLTVRSEPTTRSRELGKVYPHHKVRILCKERGEKVGDNHLWYRLYSKQEAWVSARYVKDLTPVEWCRL